MSDLFGAMTVSAHGMKAQGMRVRIISENMANASTAANTPDEDPYVRKVITFKNEMDRRKGLELVDVSDISEDRKRPFILKYIPEHPGADARGYVKTPNIDPIIETMDMREAQRTYEANVGMMDQSRTMMTKTIDLLRR